MQFWGQEAQWRDEVTGIQPSAAYTDTHIHMLQMFHDKKNMEIKALNRHFSAFKCSILDFGSYTKV